MDEKEIFAHKEEFEKIVKKYDFAQEERAQELANFLAKSNQKISHEEFAKLFGMTLEEAKVFLSFIQKGLDFGQKFNKI